MIAPFLRKGDEIRVLTPSRSLAMTWMHQDLKDLAKRRLEDLGFRVSFGKHVNERDVFDSSSVEHRVEDLHDAFSAPSVRMILSVIGGFNCNQLLQYLDYGLIRDNPKRLCGFSDITALSNAIFAKTGIVTYSGLHFFNFGQKLGFDFSLDSFRRCHMEEGPYDVAVSDQYVDERWALNQDAPAYEKNDGWWTLQEGEATGTVIGGNLCTFNLLQGTEYMPCPAGPVVLFLEDDYESHFKTFDRDLQSFLQQKERPAIAGVVIGRFQHKTEMTRDILQAIISTKRELKGIPVLANVDFGHTTPLITFPIGGTAELRVGDAASLKILEH